MSSSGEEKPLKSPRHSIAGLSLVSQTCLAIMKELGGGKMLLEFVCDLPVLKTMDKDKGRGALLSLSPSSSASDISEELATMTKKYVSR